MPPRMGSHTVKKSESVCIHRGLRSALNAVERLTISVALSGIIVSYASFPVHSQAFVPSEKTATTALFKDRTVAVVLPEALYVTRSERPIRDARHATEAALKIGGRIREL